MGAAEPAVAIRHLRKTYGPVTAADDVSFTVAAAKVRITALTSSPRPVTTTCGPSSH